MRQNKDDFSIFEISKIVMIMIKPRIEGKIGDFVDVLKILEIETASLFCRMRYR